MKNMIKRDPSHNEQIERWAEFVREHPEEWKEKVKPFLDSQIIMARRFYENLLKNPGGVEIIKELNGQE